MGTHSGYPDCFTFAITSTLLIFTSPMLVHAQSTGEKHAGLESLVTRIMTSDHVSSIQQIREAALGIQARVGK
jgi:hypothetical protein